MTRLRVELLGGFSARLDDGRPCVLPTRKFRALLAYLALPVGRFHSRDKLTALLWGDTPEAQARQSFRQALASLRRALGNGEPPGLLTEGDAIALDPQVVAVDVADLEAGLADGGTAALERVALLYKGDLLDGFSLDEPAFEQWRVVERERLHERVLEGLARLLREQLRADRPEGAIQTALRILALDPLQEAVHRALMRLLLGQGRRAAALEQYQACVGWLERELGAEPEDETRQLYREILRAASAAPRSAPGPASTLVRALAPLIGRGAEHERLRAALARMLDDEGHVILVSGEAGIGKSRLIQEFAMAAAGAGVRILLGRCHETEQALPLRPWVEALRGERSALDPGLRDRLAATTSAQLGRLFPELLDSGDHPLTLSAQPALLFDALAELIGELVSEEPLVLIVEDLHWADAMSARFLAFLGRRVHRLPVLVVGSIRPEELIDVPVLAHALTELRTEDRLSEIPLGLLSEDNSRALVRVLHPSARSGQHWNRITGEIWALSAGNPFVIVESVRALLGESPEDWARESGLARGVKDFVAARLDRLRDLPRQVVAVAAAIGRDFPFGVLPRAAGIGEREAADAVEELVRRRILAAVGNDLAFCHDRIRQVAYERLLPPTRAVLHAAIGDALEQVHGEQLDDVADQLGHHYSRAGNAQKAIAYLLRFAEVAARRYALDDASRAFVQTMACVEELPPSERDRSRLDVALRHAFVLSILGRQRDILDLLLTHANHLKRVTDPVLASEYHFRLGLTLFFLGEHAQGQLAGEQALHEGERAGHAPSIGKALHVLSLSAFEAGRPQEGIAYATRAIPLLDLPHMQAWLGLVYHDLAVNCVMAGALDAALDASTQEDGVGQAAQWPRLRALAGYATAWALALRGDADLAVETARQSLELARDPMATGLVSGALGFAYLERGDAESTATLARVVDLLRSGQYRNGEARHLALLSEAHLLDHDATAARETAARALALSQAAGMPFNIGMAQRAIGRIARADGDLDVAERHLTEALETFAACSAMFEAARTRVDLAGVRAKRGDELAARQHLHLAMATFETAGAPKRVAEASDLARSLGITLA